MLSCKMGKGWPLFGQQLTKRVQMPGSGRGDQVLLKSFEHYSYLVGNFLISALCLHLFFLSYILICNNLIVILPNLTSATNRKFQCRDTRNFFLVPSCWFYPTRNDCGIVSHSYYPTRNRVVPSSSWQTQLGTSPIIDPKVFGSFGGSKHSA